MHQILRKKKVFGQGSLYPAVGLINIPLYQLVGLGTQQKGKEWSVTWRSAGGWI